MWEVDCRPGPLTVLNEEEEQAVCEYLVKMSEMDFGLTRDMVMQFAYVIVVKSGREHPFCGQSAVPGLRDL